MSTEKDIRREAIRAKYKQDDNTIQCIQAELPKAIMNQEGTVRVAIYSRVSTDNLEQVSSIALQEDTFETLVKEHSNWVLVNTYTDEGISGTSLNHREGFQRMIADCEKGKIDMIITKSVSRFARNLLDCVHYYRYLAALPKPVYVWFVTNNINTQNPGSEMILNFLAMIAQEESRNKSEIMNWSIDSRFKKGLFLTPKLLGYDVYKETNDSKPILVINEDEAQTVRHCFGMLLNGYSTQQIAEVLNLLQRKSKRGNVKWTSGSVLSILKNERYCGDVLARKTYTPNYLDHKSKKNNHARNQYIKYDHHAPIVTREVFNFAQKIIASHRFNMNGIIPSLCVVKTGVLKGFVSVNRAWAGVTIDDYIEACEFAYKEEESETDNLEVKYGEISSFDFSGYETVSVQYFGARETPTCTITQDRLKFNAGCIRKFRGIEYIELLFNPKEFVFAIRPCSKENINAIEWASFIDGKVMSKDRGCKAFSTILFEYMRWNPNLRYRFDGVRREHADQRIFFFELKNAEVLIPDNTHEVVSGGRARRRISYYPDKLLAHYGDDYYKSIYNSRLYLIDYFKMWDAYVSSVPTKDQTELLEYAKKLMMETLPTKLPIEGGE